MKFRLIASAFTVAVMGVAANAAALQITPATVPQWTTDDNSNLSLAEVEALTGISPLVEVYKQNQGGSESGSFASSYSTSFSNAVNDPQDADIDYVGGNVLNCVASTCLLLVKDGNQEPAQYVFNLSALNWNGTEGLDLRGFWPNQGAISHVTIFTGPGAGSGGGSGGGSGQAAVPEPASLLLLGTGLSAAAWRVRRRKQTA